MPKARTILWCPKREQRQYLDLCQESCPGSRRRRCQSFQTAEQPFLPFLEAVKSAKKNAR